jgi:predicted metal-dependent phosphoesterase TrpH
MASDRQFCDLHIHSTYSDSDATIESIFQDAKKKNLKAIAITDHDTFEGIPSALEASRETGVELIRGLELSSHKDGIEVHILGYFGSHVANDFMNELKEIKDIRRSRLTAMAQKLNEIKVDVNVDELFSIVVKGNIPTRLHLALYLQKKGHVSNIVEAFRRYLSPGKPGYVSRFKYSTQEAIAAINRAGGVAFLAHPHYISNTAWIDEFTAQGLAGIEVIYPRLSAATMSKAAAHAQRLGLLQSGGSDAHGGYKEFTSVGGVEVPYEFACAIKERIEEKCRA